MGCSVAAAREEPPAALVTGVEVVLAPAGVVAVVAVVAVAEVAEEEMAEEMAAAKSSRSATAEEESYRPRDTGTFLAAPVFDLRNVE